MSSHFRLVGRVLDENQRAVPGAEVRLLRTKRSVTTDADGTFAFDDLPSARYTVSAKKDDYFAWPLLVGPEDAAEPLSLQLSRGATLIVHVNGTKPLCRAQWATLMT